MYHKTAIIFLIYLFHLSHAPKVKENDVTKQKTDPKSQLFGKSHELSISRILDAEKKNKSTVELITESAVEEITMVDINNIDFVTQSYENATDYFTESTLNSSDVTEITSEMTDTTPFNFDDLIGKKDNTKKTVFNIKTNIPSSGSSSVCSCDLTKSVCDVNCCCDRECTESHRAVFTKCMDEDIKHIDNKNMLLQYCHSKDTMFFKNNTQWLLYEEHTTPASHLFCVIKDNLPPRLMNKEPKVLSTVDEVNKIAIGYNQWTQVEQSSKSNIQFDGNNNKQYMYGDDIWVVNNSTLKLFELPTNTFNSHCSTMIKMKYMIDYKAKCIVSYNNNTNNLFLYKLYNSMDDIYIISTPNLFNTTWINNIQDCPQNVCIPIKSYICNENSCTPTNETDDIIMTKYIITSLKLYLYSNGTMGYTNATLYFGMSTMDVNHKKYIEQEFEIRQRFLGRNKTELMQALGGNPGYQNGRPIIISKMIEGNETEPSVLDFFSTKSQIYPLKNILVYPRNKLGFCILSNVTYEEIRFRENFQFSCNLVHNVNDLTKDTNATKLCVQLQDELYKMISHSVADDVVYVAKKGNPSQGLYDWVSLLHDHSNMNMIKGVLNEDNTLNCMNILSRIEYIFTYNNLEQLNVPKQLFITGVVVRYISQDIVFKINNNTMISKFSLSARFIDVTKPKPLKYARGPHFHIHLPRDFFYPFAFNGASHVRFNNVILVNIGLFAILILCNKLCM